MTKEKTIYNNKETAARQCATRNFFEKGLTSWTIEDVDNVIKWYMKHFNHKELLNILGE